MSHPGEMYQAGIRQVIAGVEGKFTQATQSIDRHEPAVCHRTSTEIERVQAIRPVEQRQAADSDFVDPLALNPVVVPWLELQHPRGRTDLRPPLAGDIFPARGSARDE